MNEETLKYRIGHLVTHVKQSFGNIAFDDIARQMEKHEVSAPFSPDRILEIFAGILWKEREALIRECILDTKSAKSTRKKAAKSLEAQKAAHEQQFDASCSENMRIRRELNALEEELNGKAWKSYKFRHDAAARAQGVQARINRQMDCVTDILQKTREISDAAERTKRDIVSVNARFADLMGDVRESVQEFLVQQRDRIEGVDLVKRYESELKVQQQITEQMRGSLAKFIAHVNGLEKETDVELDISTLSSKRVQKALNASVGGVRNRLGFGVNPVEEVEEVVQERVKAKEDEFMPQLRKQKKSMQKLQVELNAAKKRLAALLKADASLDPELMDMIEKSKKRMRATQARTDEMMKLIQDRSYSSFDSFL